MESKFAPLKTPETALACLSWELRRQVTAMAYAMRPKKDIRALVAARKAGRK